MLSNATRSPIPRRPILPHDRPAPALDQLVHRQGLDPAPASAGDAGARRRPATLLIAPTGGGKTLAGFLPTLAELGTNPRPGLHTLYVSPLKALTADIRRNLAPPGRRCGAEDPHRGSHRRYHLYPRRRQRADPPHILLTTPESLALLLTYEDAPRIFAGLQRVVVDEFHALAESKRGDQLMLGFATPASLAPGLRRVGLSATVEDPPALARYLAPGSACCWPIPAPTPTFPCWKPPRRPGPAVAGAMPFRRSWTKSRAIAPRLIFHNTRAQAELFFRDLSLANKGPARRHPPRQPGARTARRSRRR